MVENRPLQNVINYLTLIPGIVMVGFPIYIAALFMTFFIFGNREIARGYLLFQNY